MKYISHTSTPIRIDFHDRFMKLVWRRTENLYMNGKYNKETVKKRTKYVCLNGFHPEIYDLTDLTSKEICFQQ